MVEVNISDAEWLVMEALWEKAPATPAEIIETVGQRASWNHRTIRTLLRRLVDKGVVERVDDEQRSLYQATVKRRDCVREEGKTFLERVFRGDSRSLLMHFAKEAKLSQEKLKQLRSLLDEENE